MPAETRGHAPDHDVLIVGAGFAGMYMLHRLRSLGFSAIVLEKGDGVGGTWYWNRYPGARCDVESVQYSYQFDPALEQEWTWSERYAAQPEILRYANHVADRFDLRRDIRFDTTVRSAHFNEDARLWILADATGRRWRARFCVLALGCLSAANLPVIEGQELFEGRVLHTAEWPHEPFSFEGQRVGVIGTGSSAIQSVPVIAREASNLVVFQRTANYSVPAHNIPLDPAAVQAIKADYRALRDRARKMPSGIDFDFHDRSALDLPDDERQSHFEQRWRTGGLAFMGSFNDLLISAKANKTAADFVRAKIADIVKDPEVARKLQPTNIIGCKRLCVDTGYFETFNRPNVTLVDLLDEPIETMVADGIVTRARQIPLDAIVFATGFDAMTGAFNRIEIKGRKGFALADKWREGPKTYLGLAMAGFPNLFTVTGPGSPSVLTNMLPTIEQHVEWIADCLADLRANGHALIEAEPEAEEAWVAHNREVAGRSLRSTCSSWYVGANIPGKPRVFMPYIGGFPAYCEKTAEVARKGYPGFERC